jgi:hypothetical protein
MVVNAYLTIQTVYWLFLLDSFVVFRVWCSLGPVCEVMGLLYCTLVRAYSLFITYRCVGWDMYRRVVFFMIRSVAHVLFCIIKTTTRWHISPPTLRYGIYKEEARTTDTNILFWMTYNRMKQVKILTALEMKVNHSTVTILFTRDLNKFIFKKRTKNHKLHWRTP